MVKLAQIPLVGMIAATVLCAAPATEATAQDSSLVLNNQLQLGDVITGQKLDVVDMTDQVTVATSATGNSVAGSVQNDSLRLNSTQTMRGNAAATTTLSLGGDTDGVVNATTQTTGNYLAAGAYGATLDISSTQTVDAGEITAASSIRGGTARLKAGGSVGVAATANQAALGGTGTMITGTVNQSSDASVRASNLAETQYIPATAVFGSQAVGNAVAVGGESATYQNLTVNQTSTGGVIVADTSANAGNAWDLAGQSSATANQVVISNQGGALLNTTNQTNASTVRSTARVTSYDYGAAYATAQGTGNSTTVGNNDRYLELDNTQLNSGGVEVQAEFAGVNGYDAYVSSDAAGNTVTGYACSVCQGEMNVTNSQTNSGNVSAMSTTTIYNTGRAVITGANAVGNAATFYVSRPGN